MGAAAGLGGVIIALGLSVTVPQTQGRAWADTGGGDVESAANSPVSAGPRAVTARRPSQRASTASPFSKLTPPNPATANDAGGRDRAHLTRPATTPRAVPGAATTGQPHTARTSAASADSAAPPVAAASGNDQTAAAGPIALAPTVEWDAGLLRGTLGATSTLPLRFSQVSAPSLGGSLASDPNTSTPIFGSQGEFTYLPAAVALTNPGTIESFQIAVTEVTPFDAFLTGLPLIGALASSLLSATRSTPIVSTLLAPLIGTSQVVTFAETPAGLAAGRPTAFTDTVISFDGTPIRVNYFPATNVATGSVTSAPTVLLNAGLFSIGYTDPDTLYNQYSPPLTGTAPVPGIKVFRDDAFPGVYSGGGGFNVITWDSRGTFASGGQWQFYSPFFEGRDISAIIDWTTTPANPAVAQIKTDSSGVPLVGSAGGSGGGAIQLNVAATDPRIRATVPAITWNSLNTAIYPGKQFSTLYGLVFLSELAQANSLGPRAAHANGWQWPVLRLNSQGLAAFATGTALGWLSQTSQAFLGSAGPTALLAQVSAPTLLIQGTVDSLVPLRQAVDTAMAIEANPYGTPVKMIWFCGGHTPGPGGCNNPGLSGQTSVVMGDTLRWLDQYVADSGTPADAIPRFQWFDQAGTYHFSSLMPYDPGFNQPQPYTATDSGGVLGIVPLLGGSLRIPLTPPPGSQVVGSPTLSFTYQGLGTGSAVYASVVDTSTPFPYVVGQIVTPVPVTLDGRPRTVTIALNDIAYTAPGAETDTLSLQIGASTPVLNPTGLPVGEIYGLPYSNLGALGAIKISDVRLDLPVRAATP